MDLVDIDKVLDDFEFNEEKLEIEKIEQQKKEKNLKIAEKLNESTVSSISSASAGASSKNYVNVSNVFSSLNEYVNAGLDISKLNDEKSSNSSDEPQKKSQRKLKKKQKRCKSSKFIKKRNSSSSSTTSTSSSQSITRSSITSQSSDDDENKKNQQIEQTQKLINDDDDDLIKTNISSSFNDTIDHINDETVSATFSNEIVNLNDLSSISPITTKIDDEIKNDEKSSVKMIAFESTMDDVSDTELESYLQELELETTTTTLTTNDCKIIAVKQIDNISQASTIECNEILVENCDFDELQIIVEPNQPKRPTTLELTETTTPVIISELTEEDGAVGLPINSDSDVTPSTVQQTEELTSSQIHLICLGLTVNQLGKIQPYWMPDNTSNSCMQCKLKFSIIKRRHHCRACGQVLCSQCCSLRAKLDYLGDIEARVCIKCDVILNKNEVNQMIDINDDGTIANESIRSPNPNNPMEYCSIVPPHQQVLQEQRQQQISVMVPVGVLKREGAPKTSRKEKNVIFSDGIRPGCDLTELDHNWETKQSSVSKIVRKTDGNKRVQTPTESDQRSFKMISKLPNFYKPTHSYIPIDDDLLPPIYTSTKTEFKFTDVVNNIDLIERLKNETIKFAIQRNFFVLVKIIKLSCCINKTVINFTTQGMHNVGQDEIIILLEIDEKNVIPKDLLIHLNEIYLDAEKGNVISELGFSTSIQNHQNFLGSKEHGGFLYIRPTFQCLQNTIIPESPYLIGLLIHKWEVPWAKIFPLRLMLRLGALYRYYPSPHVSERGRDSVYAEIGQTIINFLADFRTYSYTLTTIRGMTIHIDRNTTVEIPKNRYDQIVKALNNSSDHILALGGNFSKKADGHLVCIQNLESDDAEMHSYSTQAINIQGQPRKVTAGSFLVLNGALKTTSGLSGKCNIVEDGLMIQILPATMISVRESLKAMKDIDLICGKIDEEAEQRELVKILWVENDLEFNLGVRSPIDKKEMDGIVSIRAHNTLDYSNANHMIRWTEVFIIKSDEESSARDPVNVSKISEQIAKCASAALSSFLDLLAANSLTKIGLRVTLDPENVGYEAGSQYNKLGPLYMNSLDCELISTLHRLASNLTSDTPIILELIFHILDK